YSIAVRRDIQPHITARIVYNGPVRAPIARGAPVATLEIHGTGLPAHSIPLVAMHAIGKAGPIDRIVGGLLGLFS
ncbi:MAG: D-alanyl-D-alanine carboxypeptidase, partial [Novosphingobium sp.]